MSSKRRTGLQKFPSPPTCRNAAGEILPEYTALLNRTPTDGELRTNQTLRKGRQLRKKRESKMNNVESQMENGVHIVRVAKPKERSCKWLGICAFTLLAASTLFFALLHFEVIPSPAKKEEFKMPEILRIQTYLDSLPKTGAQQSDGKKLVAHLAGAAKDKQKITWQGTTMNTLMEAGLKIQNNELVIPRDGLYFVYTQVVFTGSSCSKAKPIQLTHKVTKSSKSYGKEQAILSSTKTACEVPSPSAWFQPMYQGGVFELEKGDVLRTETTNVDSVDFNDGKTYFGIVAV